MQVLHSAFNIFIRPSTQKAGIAPKAVNKVCSNPQLTRIVIQFLKPKELGLISPLCKLWHKEILVHTVKRCNRTLVLFYKATEGVRSVVISVEEAREKLNTYLVRNNIPQIMPIEDPTKMIKSEPEWKLETDLYGLQLADLKSRYQQVQENLNTQIKSLNDILKFSAKYFAHIREVNVPGEWWEDPVSQFQKKRNVYEIERSVGGFLSSYLTMSKIAVQHVDFEDVLPRAVKEHHATILQHGSEIFNNDESFIFACVSQYGMALVHASPEIRAVKKVVLAAVKQNGRALQYASTELKGDKEVVREAFEEAGSFVLNASKELRGDEEFMLSCVEEDASTIFYIEQNLKTKAFILKAVYANPLAIKFLHKQYKEDPDVIATARSRDSGCLVS